MPFSLSLFRFKRASGSVPAQAAYDEEDGSYLEKSANGGSSVSFSCYSYPKVENDSRAKTRSSRAR